MKALALNWHDYQRKAWLLDDYIKAACKRIDTNSVKEMKAKIKNGLAVPVMFSEGGKILGLMVLELAEGVLNVTILAGKFKPGYIDELDKICEKVARSQGRTKVQMGGRKAWQRILLKYGCIKDKHDMMVKDYERNSTDKTD